MTPFSQGVRMAELPNTGAPVWVHFDDSQRYAAQVMFTHVGDPAKVFVAWLDQAPEHHNEVADWVDAERVRPFETPGGGSPRKLLL